MCLDNRARVYKSPRKEVSNARILAGNTNKALWSAATLAVLDALDAITSQCRRPKLKDLKTSIGYSECQRSACGTSAGQSAAEYLQSTKNNIVTVFHSVKAARLGGPRCFLNLPQMRTNE